MSTTIHKATESQRIGVISPGHTAGEWWYQDPRAGLSDSRALLKTTVPHFLPEQPDCMALPHPISCSLP